MDTSDASNGDEQQPLPQSISSLFERYQDDRGILCNDPSGLCLAAQGNIDPTNAGIYTSLVRLAAQLPEASGGESSEDAGAATVTPVITIEFDSHAMIVKEYDGHAVAVRVPTTRHREASVDAEPINDEANRIPGSQSKDSTES